MEFQNKVRIGIDMSDGKKSVKLPKNWNDITASIYNGEENFAVLTGKVNDIVVVDLDKKNDKFEGLKWFEDNCGQLSDLNTLVTKTLNDGFHVYFKYNELLKNKINVNNLHIDILTDKRCAFEGARYNVIHDRPIRALTETELTLLVKECEGQRAMRSSDGEDSERDDKLSDKQLEEILNGLSLKRVENRDDWIRLGYFLTVFKHGEQMFKDISKKSSKYDESRHDLDWSSFKNGECDKPISIGTIIMWLKEDNRELYNKVMKENKIIKELDTITGDYQIKHKEITKMTKKSIEVECEVSKALQPLHKMMSKECPRCDLYGLCCHNGYILACKNCDFQYPDQRIEINRHNAPTIYNTLTIINNEENINNKDTLQVALRIKDESAGGLVYTERGDWYKYKSGPGMYEKMLEIEVINQVDKIVGELREAGEKEEWFDWMNKISYKENLLRELRAKCFKRVELDGNDDLIGFRNGVYDLKSDAFRKGEINEYITMKCGVDYVEDADTSLAESMLSSTFPNEGEREYALNRFAMALEGRNREQTMTFNYGYTASNGKSYLMERLKRAFGDYGETFAVNLLTNKMKGAGEANTTLINFKNKRFMYCSEPESGSKLNTNFVKLLTGDIVKARGLYVNKEEAIKPSYNIFVCCNTLPTFDAYDEGIARRIRVIEFKTKFVENPKRQHEKEIKKYTAEEERTIEEGLMTLLVDRYEHLKNVGYNYKEPDELRRLRKMYTNDNKDEITNLLMENYEVGNDSDWVKMSDVKSVLKTGNIREKDIITIQRIVEDLFSGCQYVHDRQWKGERYSRVFWSLKVKC
jgi:putative DNA primase/helicase